MAKLVDSQSVVNTHLSQVLALSLLLKVSLDTLFIVAGIVCGARRSATGWVIFTCTQHGSQEWVMDLHNT